ncbi:MAG TPA: TrkH family potassium uptake protein [Thermodesulfobacteriota bacterium]|nr:TrkH family potassium uptake protein [Thermodesulfobacteriota bacterium]
MPLRRAARLLLRRLTPAQLVLVSFAAAILLGTGLLALPGMAAPGTPAPRVIDLLFVATSAVCVTGLTPLDLGSRFSPLGQLVILLLVQAGGLGIMTYSTLVVLLLRGRLTVRGRLTLEDTLGRTPVELDLRRLIRTVFTSSFVIEGAGAVLLTARFVWDMPAGEAVWFGLFHAVSAFNNAGLSLFPDSLGRYVGDPLVNAVVPLLIILGGLGFLVLDELWAWRERRQRVKPLSLHTKLVLSTSALLIGLGMVGFYLLERANTLAELPATSALLATWFHAVVPRTAGFNTLDVSRFANPTLFLTIVLMFIGASPGSTGGGIKTTTAAILWGIVRSQFRGEERVHLFRRALPRGVVGRAVSIAAGAALVVAAVTLALQVTETLGAPTTAGRALFLELLFETVSAFGTVGLSTGVTPRLTDAGKLLIVLTMYVGRVGPLTLTLGLARRPHGRFQYCEEPVVVG